MTTKEYAEEMVKNMTPQEALDLTTTMPDSATGSPLAAALLAKIAVE
jgi:hypothetical protein